MAEREPAHGGQFLVRRDQPLIGIPLKEDGEEVVQYFTDDEGVDAVSTSDSVQRALSLAGAWKDLGDWNEALDALDRIRHENKPTPPIDL
ncbi:MAG: hypothetical protein HY331_16600 [Chloroflexi bacterium]|nr:hypothetical protein [Chloroflexota bacterium]